MTISKIKEEISLHLFAALAARAGYKSIFPRVDDGTDLMLQPTRILAIEDQVHFTPTNDYLGIQMKMTTWKEITSVPESIQYRLRAKNYNDLIASKNEWLSLGRFGIPLILVLHVLPENEADWVQFDLRQQQYTMNGLFYWHFPERDADFSTKSSRQLVAISQNNFVGLNTFDAIFDLFFQKVRP